jgi:hypothetical protein
MKRDRLVKVSAPPSYAAPVGRLGAGPGWTWIGYPTILISALTGACVVLAMGIPTGKPLWEFALYMPVDAALLARWVWVVPVRYRREQTQAVGDPLQGRVRKPGRRRRGPVGDIEQAQEHDAGIAILTLRLSLSVWDPHVCLVPSDG